MLFFALYGQFVENLRIHRFLLLRLFRLGDIIEPTSQWRSIMLAERKLPETVPTQADIQLAQESSQRLSKVVSRGHTLRLTTVEDEPEPVEIPAAAAQLLVSLLAEMAKGNAVTLIPIHAELTTQRVADLLGVSRPYIVKEIEKGRLPGSKVGKHRRVKFEDLIAYKRRMDINRQKALDELSALDQELGLT